MFFLNFIFYLSSWAKTCEGGALHDVQSPTDIPINIPTTPRNPVIPVIPTKYLSYHLTTFSPTVSAKTTYDFQQVSSDFYFEATKRSWSGCLAYGHYHGYELASIRSKAEFQDAAIFLSNYNALYNLNIKELWTGGYQAPNHNDWVWTDGFDFDSVLWPLPQQINQDRCVVLDNLKQLKNEDCGIQNLCIFRIRETNGPSIGTVPSIETSTSLSPSISSKQSLRIIPSTNHSGISPPTRIFVPVSMSPTKAWNIGAAFVNFKVNVNPQMEITHFIGSAASSVVVTLLSYDCDRKVAVTDTTFLVDSGTMFTNAALSDPTAMYTVEFSDLGSSSSLLAFDENVRFCTKVELLDKNDFSVSFRMQKFSFKVDLSVGFTSISVNIEESDIEQFTFRSIEFYGITTCLCQTDFSCSPATVEQDTNIGICISTSSSGVRYIDFDLTVTGNGATGFNYQPVIVGSNGSEGQFGTTIETQDHVTKINFPLVTDLFNDDASYIIVTGSGLLKFIPNSSKLSEDQEQKLQVISSDDATREFVIQVILQPPLQSSLGCLKILWSKFNN